MLGTLIVAAAGLGTRMGSKVPKALQPVAGQPMIRWIVDAFVTHINELVVVTAPGRENEFALTLARGVNLPMTLVVQPRPTGTADAVRLGLAQATGDTAAVVWGDHLGAVLFPDCWYRDPANRLGPGLTLPLVEIPNPYVYFTPDADGHRIVANETKTGAPEVSTGFSDCGVFLLRREVALAAIDALHPERPGAEVNFLSLFSRFPAVGAAVDTVTLAEPRLALGVNTPQQRNVVAAALGLEGHT